jgi:hypothetical protein
MSTASLHSSDTVNHWIAWKSSYAFSHSDNIIFFIYTTSFVVFNRIILEESSEFQEFIEALTKTHSEICPWRTVSSPAHFTTLSMDHSKLIRSFTQRMRSFVGDFPLPLLDRSFIDSLVSLFQFFCISSTFDLCVLFICLFSSLYCVEWTSWFRSCVPH